MATYPTIARTILSVFIILCLNSTTLADESKTLRMAIDDLCPLVCIHEKDRGIFADVVESILIPQGYSIEYVVRPWGRSLLELQTGKLDLLAAVDPSSYPYFKYHLNDIYIEQACFYGLYNLEWSYQGIDSLQNVKLGMVHYDLTNEETGIFHDITSNTDRFNISYIMPSEDGVIKRALQFINSGRVDVMLLNRSVAEYSSTVPEVMPLYESIKNYGCLKRRMGLKLAISPKQFNAKHIAKLLGEGVEALKVSGEYHAILAKYGLSYEQ